MRVKSILLVATYLVLGIYFSSCDQQALKGDSATLSPSNQEVSIITTQKEANIALAPFIRLDEKKREYSLDITKEEAMRLGVTDEMYENVCQEVKKTNLFIKEHDEKHPGELILTKPLQ